MRAIGTAAGHAVIDGSILVVALLMTLPAAALAQDWKAAQSDYSIRHWVKPPEEKTLNPDLARAEAERFMGGINALIERVAALPAFKAPRDERCHQVQAMYPPVQPDAPAPPKAEVQVKTYSWVRVSCLANDRFTRAGFTIHVNQPGTIGTKQWQGELPKRGLNHYKDRTVVVRSAAPLLLPISKQRYVEELIAAAEKRVREAEAGQTRSAEMQARLRNMPAMPGAAENYEKWQRDTKPRALASIEQWTKTMRELKRPEHDIETGRARMQADLARQEKSLLASVEREKKNPPKQQRTELSPAFREQARKMREGHIDHLESLRTQLAALSPEQRRAPACSPPLVRAGPQDECRKGVTLVEINPAFFDKAPPRGDIQLVVLRSPYGASRRDLEPLWKAAREVLE